MHVTAICFHFTVSGAQTRKPLLVALQASRASLDFFLSA